MGSLYLRDLGRIRRPALLFLIGSAFMGQEAPPAVGRQMHAQADIMKFDSRTVMGRASDRNLEFAWQEAEFRMQARPLPQQFAIRSRIQNFVSGDTRKLICRDVADAIA